MTLENILSTISARDDISIQSGDLVEVNGTGILFNGKCADFRSTCENAHKYLDKKVDAIRAYKSIIVILL